MCPPPPPPPAPQRCLWHSSSRLDSSSPLTSFSRTKNASWQVFVWLEGNLKDLIDLKWRWIPQTRSEEDHHWLEKEVLRPSQDAGKSDRVVELTSPWHDPWTEPPRHTVGPVAPPGDSAESRKVSLPVGILQPADSSPWPGGRPTPRQLSGWRSSAAAPAANSPRNWSKRWTPRRWRSRKSGISARATATASGGPVRHCRSAGPGRRHGRPQIRYCYSMS